MDGKRRELKEQISYDRLCSQADRERLDELVQLMLEVMVTISPSIRIGRNEYPTAFVQERFRLLRDEHIEHILDSLDENTTRVHNTKAYLLTALFNEAATIGNSFALRVNHDLYGGKDSISMSRNRALKA